MNLIHIKLTFEDVSSGEVIVRECTRSIYTYNRMMATLNSIVNVFDGVKQ